MKSLIGSTHRNASDDEDNDSFADNDDIIRDFKIKVISDKDINESPFIMDESSIKVEESNK